MKVFDCQCQTLFLFCYYLSFFKNITLEYRLVFQEILKTELEWELKFNRTSRAKTFLLDRNLYRNTDYLLVNMPEICWQHEFSIKLPLEHNVLLLVSFIRILYAVVVEMLLKKLIS